MVQQLIEQGLQEHHAGRLEKAKLLYEQALALEPRHPDALQLAGVVALQSGEAERAVALIRRAIEVRPAHPAYHANLAQAWLALGKLEQAHAAFRQALALDPHNPQPAVGAANCLAMQRRFAQAERQLRDVVSRFPGYALAWLNLAHAVRDQGRLDEAEQLYRHALRLEPGMAEAQSDLGGVLHAAGRSAEAEEAYRRHLVLQPDSERALVNLASLLMDCGRFAEAEALCRNSLAQRPESAELLLALGSALALQGRPAAALEPFRKAARIAPEHPRALWAYGSTLCESGRPDEGLAWLERHESRFDAPEYRDGMAAARLAAGALQAGWAGYGWRAARREFEARNPGIELATTLPAELRGRRICLLREQGLGDELFFLRFVAALKRRGAEVGYRSHRKIASILERVAVLDRLIGPDEPLPAADCVMLIGDLPAALGRFEASLLRPSPAQELRLRRDLGFPRLLRVFFPEPPAALPLAPLPERVERIRLQLSRLGPPPYVGVTWRAGTMPETQRGANWSLYKQVPLEPLAEVLRGIDGTAIALQRLPAAGELRRLAELSGHPLHDLTALNEDLEDMLALLAAIDDYIGVSNTNMHLRAGVGLAAHVLVPRPAEWRWLNSGDTSPWFPGFRIYRQDADGDWSAAFSRLARAISQRHGRARSL